MTIAEIPPTIRSDAGGLQQVLLNVLINAIDASPKGGVVRMKAIHDERSRSLLLEVEDGGTVEKTPETPVIVMTAYGSVETAVEAIKLGAEEYLIKPLKSPDELRLVVARVLRGRALRDQSLLHQEESEATFPKDIAAESEGMKRVLRLAGQVAAQFTTVLLTGESGTGKEVVARLIHRRSPRRESAFVAVNCAAITETLLESEFSAMRRGLSPAPRKAGVAASNWPTVAPCSWTRSLRWDPTSRPSFCEF